MEPERTSDPGRSRYSHGIQRREHGDKNKRHNTASPGTDGIAYIAGRVDQPELEDEQ